MDTDRTIGHTSDDFSLQEFVCETYHHVGVEEVTPKPRRLPNEGEWRYPLGPFGTGTEIQGQGGGGSRWNVHLDTVSGGDRNDFNVQIEASKTYEK